MFNIPQEVLDEVADNKFMETMSCKLPKEKQSKLMHAAKIDDLATVRSFIEEEGIWHKERMNNPGEQLVHIAARHGSLKVIDYLLKRDPSLISETDQHGFDPLYIAIEEGLADVVQFLVEKCNADINEANKRNYRGAAIHSAVEFGHLNIVKYLIEKRHVDVNTLTWDTHAEPPLFLAVRYQRDDIVDYLVNEAKANVTILSGRLENVLFIAVRKDNLPLMKYLWDEKKTSYNVNWLNDGFETLAYVASNLNRFNILKYLVGEKHANVTIAERWTAITCLHLAASNNNFEICKYLVEHGADPKLKDKEGKIAAKHATDEHLIRYLETHQSNRSRRSVASSTSNLTFRSIDGLLGSRGELVDESRYLAGQAVGQAKRGTEVHSGGCFQSLLLMLTSVVRLTNSFNQPIFRTPQKEIDPIAVDVVSGAYRIRK